MDSLWTDLRHVLRGFLRRPGFAFLVVAVLAVGLGANAVVFSVVDSVLLRPLPLPQSEELVQVWSEKSWFSKEEVTFLRDHAEGLDLAGYYAWSHFALDGDTGPRVVQGSVVTAGYFDVLGLPPVAGRYFRPDEERPGAPPVAVISRSLWERELGGEDSTVGSTLKLDGQAVTVVGVVPADVRLPRAEAEIWRPLVFDPSDDTDWTSRYVQVIGRGDPATAVATGERLALLYAERFAPEGPDAAQRVGKVVPLRERMVGPIRPTLLALLVAVGAVLLVASVNVAHLLLARVSGRRRELAVRSAMGAGRRRLVRLLLIESLVLAALGGAAGLAVAFAAVGPLGAALADVLPRAAEIGADGRLVLAGGGMAFLVGLLFGALPAWRIARAELFPALRESSAGGLGRSRVHGTLVVAEVALAFVLVTAAGLVGRSYWTLYTVEPGFDSEQVVTFRPVLSSDGFDDWPATQRFYAELQQRLEGLPGVEAVGMNHMLPVANWGFNGELFLQGEPTPEGEAPIVNWRVVSPGYFDALGVPIVGGRDLAHRDADGAVEVAVVNRTFAERFFADASPIGRRLRHGAERHTAEGDEAPWVEIVGVVGDVRQHGLENDIRPEIYRPLAQVERPVGQSFFVRAAGGDGAEADPRALFVGIRDTVERFAPGMALTRFETMDEVVWSSIGRPRLVALLFLAFGSLALFLAMVGIYGVVAYEVTERVREIGLRMALGADRGGVLALVLGQTLRRTALGLVVGLALAVVGGRWISSLLFRVERYDPLVLGAVAAVVVGVACLSALRPAWRAAGVDPLEALRQE